MPVHPMIASLRRHRLTTCLLVLQVAVTCAVVANAAFLIVQRVHRVDVPSGLAESGLSILTLHRLHADPHPLGQYLADVDALRGLAGVQAAALVDGVPLSNGESAYGICAGAEAFQRARAARTMQVPGCAQPAVYSGGPGVVRALGLDLVAGRDFRNDEYVPGKANFALGDADAVIISRALAQRLYPDKPAVGQMLYMGADLHSGHGKRVVGVVAHLQRGMLRKASDYDQAMLVPSEPANGWAVYAVRSRPQDQARVLAAASKLLDARHPDRLGSDRSARTYAQMRADYFSRDTTMIGLLTASALGLLFVTALGIGGLASFWVQQRRRSIGIRRAVGASRNQILRYFMAENLLIVGTGAVLGAGLAVLLNLLLMRHYELPRLPGAYLPLGAVALCVLGQLAVMAPARRAAAVPPVVATRSG